ncbi:glycosyltransferase family 4 protein [Bacillus thuringiensis]|uniref:glycosyltransferase family 4 protein n=1 Tax=Bacillus thuringiensis TaxID=1428 RepID=UPI000BF43380|nr:glycosyltransferase family 4 protein [Bacillus thuringiensis]MED3055819.1 glycosyltransferase family 4 protein [Bacillus thuringiensis]PFW42175.1 glycoside hydrolase [Bacillus thuringiensis]
MQKILIVNSFYYPDIRGGAEISTQLLAEDLSKNHEVFVLTTGKNRDEIIKEEINNVKVYRLPCKNIYWPNKGDKRNNISKLIWHLINNYNPIQKKIIKEIIKEISPSLIHTQNLMGVGTYLWDVADELDIPVVHTTRDYALINPVSNDLVNQYIKYCNKKRSQKVNSVVGISKYILNEHNENKFFRKASNNVIHNIVQAEKYPKQKKEDKKGLTLGYYGQLETNKGIDILLQTIKEIPHSIVDKVFICGVGSIEDQLKTLVQNDKRFIFKGKTPLKEVYRTMASSDLTIVPSVWEEPFGRVIIESYQQGTPVIASAVGGIPEVISQSDFLFNNIEEIKDKINKFYSSGNEEVQQIIEDCYIHAEKYKDNLQEYCSVYNQL